MFLYVRGLPSFVLSFPRVDLFKDDIRPNKNGLRPNQAQSSCQLLVMTLDL